MKEITFGPNAVIFKRGDVANGYYKLTSGLVKLSRLSRDGDSEETFAVKQCPELIGFRARLTGGPYMETATSITGVTLEAFSKGAFVMSDIIYSVEAESQVLINRLESIIYDSVLIRTARLILKMMNNEAEVVGLPRNEMAQVIGTTPEGLSRAIAIIADKGYIKTTHKKITVITREHLRLMTIGKQDE